MRYYLVVLWSIVLLALSACGVASPIVVTATPSPTLPPTETPTLQPTQVVTATPTSTPTSTPTQLAVVVRNTPIGCQPRADWPLYTVRQGDNLGNIARRVNSTIDLLSLANCLANPNSIIVGQQLRVPNNIIDPISVGYVNILPFVTGASGPAELTPGATTTLVWPDAPRDAYSVDFVLLSSATGGSQVLGTDVNPADGASITWTVPATLNAQLAAYAYRADYSMYRYANSRLVLTRPPQGNPQPEILYFREGTSNGRRTIQWATNNVASVNVIWSGANGMPGGSYVRQPANGYIWMPDLGPEFSPEAMFYLFALDANGNEIRDPQVPNEILGSTLAIPVNGGVVGPMLSASPNPALRGGDVTLSWNVPGVSQVAISIARPNEAGVELVAPNLSASGSMQFTLPWQYVGTTSFMIHPNIPGVYGQDYATAIVSIVEPELPIPPEA